jgi:alginate O-acetyltransferase complex protein AlgI
MVFNSLVFFFFLACTLAVYTAMRTRRARVGFLLVASYGFYAYADWRFAGLLATSTLVDFAVGKKLACSPESRTRRRWLFLSLGVNLAILAYFKYVNFFADTANALASVVGIRMDPVHLNVLLPLGISFYTFRTLSYTIDIYRKQLTPTYSLLDYALVVSFFPTIVAGPIERASSMLPQLACLRPASRQQVGEGLALIVMGLFRKVLIGDAAGRIVDNLFGQPDLYRSPELLAGLFLFAIQIYADFSGYSHIARGVAKLFGIELMKNFEQPYFARSFSEFWRR